MISLATQSRRVVLMISVLTKVAARQPRQTHPPARILRLRQPTHQRQAPTPPQRIHLSQLIPPHARQPLQPRPLDAPVRPISRLIDQPPLPQYKVETWGPNPWPAIPTDKIPG